MNEWESGDRRRQASRENVIAVLRELGPLSRAEIVERTALSRATVSSVVAELKAAGLVREEELAAQNAPAPQGAQRPDTALRDSLRATLAFVASFDRGFDADYAHGDRLIYTAPSYSKLDAAVADVVSPEIVIAKGQGRYGDALHFE